MLILSKDLIYPTINNDEGRGIGSTHLLYDCKGITAMLFIDNKYTIIYYRIINRSKNRTTDGYTEKHHIVPKSLGGTNDKSNIAVLTAREHYICHLLLTRMTIGKNKNKMVYAAAAFRAWASKHHKRKIYFNSRTFQTVKELRQSALQEQMADPENKKKSSDGAKKLWANSDYKKEASEKRKQLWNNPEYLSKMKARKRTFKKVIIDSIEYSSLREAATALNLDPSTISKRCSSQHIKFANWNYV